jgi:mRNA interferase MazF
MRRGEICLVDLEPVRGAEASKTRPAVIVSNDGANITATRLGRGVVTVFPVTSNVEQIYPLQVLLTAAATGLQPDSKAQARSKSARWRLNAWVAVWPWLSPASGMGPP